MEKTPSNTALEAILKDRLPSLFYGEIKHSGLIGEYLRRNTSKKVVEVMTAIRDSVFEIFGEEPEQQIDLMTDSIHRACVVILRNQIDLEIQSEELNTSFLTGLPNQRLGVKVIKRLISKNRAFAWTFLDLDRLKSMNLAFGEHVVDRLIRAIGDRITKNIRTNEADGYNDMAVHRSGDEFWLILNRADLQRGMQASQNLLSKIQNEPLIIKLNQLDLEYLKNIIEKLSSQKKLDEFEEIALRMAREAVNHLTGSQHTFIDRREHERVSFLPVKVSASMGCVPFIPPQEADPANTDMHFENMSSLIKYAEEKAKMSGRGRVIGYDGQKYFQFNDQKTIIEID
ncbi:MAG: GGDEF domain-containing protein [Candidatus Altimarinota bacterium]